MIEHGTILPDRQLRCRHFHCRAWCPAATAGLPQMCGPVPGYMASLMPTRMSQLLTGQEVKNPTIMPICMKNQ